MYDNFEERRPPREDYRPVEKDVEELWKNNISSGINFEKYDDIKVTMQGENKPKPIEKFSHAGLHDTVMRNVTKAGFKTPTPVQKNALPIVMEARDLMACAQTGSGKTAAFLLPILNHVVVHGAPVVSGSRQTPAACIICPTRELAIQIWEEARKFGQNTDSKAVCIYGGTSTGYQRDQLMRGCNVLVATPGRLNDFTERGLVNFSKLQFLVLDEADRMLDMGFMPDIRRVVSSPSMPPKSQRQTLMFSATFPEEIRRTAREFLSNYIYLAVGLVGGACTDVSQKFMQAAGTRDKRQNLVDLLTDPQRDVKERTLVFVKTKRNADFIATFLSDDGFPTTSIHGDRLQSERETALADFRSGRMPILVATSVAARGLDIRDVMHVVNYDMPDEVEEYVHRIGRTGRVGNTGRATSFFDPSEDRNIARPLVEVLVKAKQPVPDWLGSMGGRMY